MWTWLCVLIKTKKMRIVLEQHYLYLLKNVYSNIQNEHLIKLWISHYFQIVFVLLLKTYNCVIYFLSAFEMMLVKCSLFI